MHVEPSTIAPLQLVSNINSTGQSASCYQNMTWKTIHYSVKITQKLENYNGFTSSKSIAPDWKC
jgi:hypothetical protein